MYRPSTCESAMSKKFEPGVLCYLNEKCGIPDNVGKIVELVSFHGEYEGQRWWIIKPTSPLMMVLQFGPFIIDKQLSSENCESAEYCMVPINDPLLEVDDATTKDIAEVL